MCRFDLVYDENRMDTVFFDTTNDKVLSDNIIKMCLSNFI